MNWPQEHDARLVVLIVTEGRTYSQAASEINDRFGTSYTRNAAIGRAARLGLAQKKLVNAAAPRSTKRAPHPKPDPKPRRAKPYKPAPLPDIASPVIAIETPAPAGIFGDTPRMIDLMELQPHSCRFPFGDAAPFLFCGAAQAKGYPYCAEHVAVTHNPEARR